jgi:hypothetical protein
MTFVSTGVAGAQEIWFGPRGPDVRPGGAADWNDLFKPTQAWAALASKIQVFVITAGYVVQVSDAELTAAAADLAARHIVLALGMQSVDIQPGDTCGHQEGYGPVGYSLKAAQKLSRLGIRLRYLALDEPLWFGHYEGSDQGCKLPIDALAKRVAANVKAYAQFFPDMVLGDIEPVPLITTYSDWQTAFVTFAEQLRRDTGLSLSFLQTDVDWRVPSFPRGLHTVADFAHRHGLRLGIIYNGDGLDKDGAAWAKDALHHADIVEAVEGIVPDQAAIETWDQQPTRVLPVTADSTLGYVADKYGNPRPHLVARFAGHAVTGRLTDAAGRPLQDVPILLERSGVAQNLPPDVQSATGVVPHDARFAILGVRVNTECLCSGANDLLVGDPSYRENGHVVQTYPLVRQLAPHALTGWAGAGVAIEHLGGQDFVHLVVTSDNTFGINSPAFAVTPDANFEFQVPLGAVHGDGMFGTATLIWLDAARHGFRRTNIHLGPAARLVAACKTTYDGTFDCRLPDGDAAAAAGNHDLRATFAGDAGYRQASVRLP